MKAVFISPNLITKGNMKTKIKPVLIQSREGFNATVADIVTHKLRAAALLAEMEEKVVTVQKRYQDALADLDWAIEAGMAGAQVWAESHRGEFGDKKSVDLVTAVAGFRTTPPRVEKSTKDTWGKIALKLQALVWGDKYVREAAPEVNKDALLTDRATLTEEQLKAAGVRFEQDELFYVDPKSQVASSSVREAA